ncbi:ATP-binding protein [Variovorax paradoxus]|uniref:ATP-binding protein n=1 Tax=Variovorax paradoxus TaxID=34073 RepID=UPI0009BCBE46|nr:ATP-binding protein [Variovorax paradoxus]
MAKIHVTAKRDFIETLVASKPIAALAEVIWNGFDADSDTVDVRVELNDMDGLAALKVRDDGYGIDPSKIESMFGGLGESWKKAKYKQRGRALHGKNGKGRFKAFALGERVQWKTTYKDEATGKRFSYQIVGHLNSLDDFDVSEPKEVALTEPTGTEVSIQNLRHDFKSLRDGSTLMELAKVYAAYLTEYPNLRLTFDGETVEPRAAQLQTTDIQLDSVRTDNGRIVPVTLSIIEWKVQTERVLHLCDPSGVALHAVVVGPQVRAPGFEFTAYIKSELFRELDKSNALVLADLHQDVQQVMTNAKSKLKAHFRKRLAENQSEVVKKWKEEKIYPFVEKNHLDPVEAAERQVFDILAVNVQSYLPSFEEADHKSRKFTFQLLAYAVRENPDSVQTIISEVLGLKRAEQDDLAELLSKTTLSSIISAAKTVSSRLDFLIGLEDLIFDKETKKKLLERDQLHKMLEQEAWLFHEEFSLAGSEQRLEEVLDKHLAILGPREDDPIPVNVPGGKQGRVDLMLSKSTRPRSGEYDYLIVELKRPSKKIDSEVLTQIEKYAIAVAGDERFRDVPARWTFIAISNDLDEYAKKKANQRGIPKGRVYDDAENNVTVWVKPWADVINDARSKLDFVNQQLSYEADKDSSKAYLKKTHARFIPDVPVFSDDEMQIAEEATMVSEVIKQEASLDRPHG